MDQAWSDGVNGVNKIWCSGPPDSGDCFFGLSGDVRFPRARGSGEAEREDVCARGWSLMRWW